MLMNLGLDWEKSSLTIPGYQFDEDQACSKAGLLVEHEFPVGMRSSRWRCICFSGGFDGIRKWWFVWFWFFRSEYLERKRELFLKKNLMPALPIISRETQAAIMRKLGVGMVHNWINRRQIWSEVKGRFWKLKMISLIWFGNLVLLFL